MPNEKEYLAKKSLLNTKQDLLIPGDNITIINNRISAQAPVVDVLVNNQSVIGLDSVARVEVDTVSPNPIDTPTDTLTSVEINGTVYELQGGGGGGSSVIPNPQGTPTDTLNTIEIDSTIYDIAGSGGVGNGNGKADLIYRAIDTNFVDISFDISKYDLYIINTSDNLSQSGETYTITREALKYYLDNNISFCGWPYSTTSPALIQYIVTANGFKADAHALGFVITSIYGINTGTILAPQIFSTEEKEIGVWIDNKPLYQKTYDLNNMTVPDNTWTNNLLNTTGTGINITHYEGIFGLGSTNYEFSNFSYYRNSGEFFTAMIATDNDNINVRPNMNAGTPVTINRVTIQYTKNSDIPGSGSYGTLGVPMEHYDDTERVIGTYFGETLYKKTIPNISITGTTNTISTGANIGTLVAVEATGYKIDGGGNIIRFKESYNDGGDTFDVEGINNDIRVICSSWFTGSTVDITIKYTKATT